MFSKFCKMKIFALMLAIIMVILPLGGCKSTTNDTNGNTSANASANEPVSLRFMWWGGDERHKATLAAIDLYMEQHPNVKIEAEYQGYEGYRDKLTTQLAGGTAADIMQFDYLWRQDLAEGGDFFVDFKEYPDNIDLTQFDMGLVEPYGVVKGILFGLPTGLGPQVLQVNKKSCAAYGVDISYDWTWEDLITEGKKPNQSDPEAYFLAGLEYETILLPYVIQQTGKQFVGDDYTVGFTKEELQSGFEYIKRLYDEKVYLPAAEFASNQTLVENPKWISGQLVAAFNWASGIEGDFSENPEDAEVVMYPIPKDAKDSGVVCPISQLLTVSKKSAHVEEAVNFVNAFLNDADMVKVLGTVRSIPASKAAMEALEKDNLLNPVVVKAVELSLSNPGLIYNGITDNEELRTIATAVIEEFRYGRLTPEQAADELIKRYENKLAELKQMEQ